MATFDLNHVALTTVIADISSAGQVFIAIPDDYSGEIIEVRTALGGAIANVDAGITLKINAVAVTNGTLTVGFSGSAAGDVDTARPTGANAVAPGDAIEIETDGASTNAVALHVTVVIRR